MMNGTGCTVGYTRSAEGGAEIHKRRYVAATAGFGKKGGGGFLQEIAPGFGCDIFSVIEKASDDAVDISIQDRHALIKGKGGDGCCRVGANAFKF